MAISDHPVDIVSESASKLTCLADLLSHSHRDCRTDLSVRGFEGLNLILTEIQIELNKAVPCLALAKAEV